MSPNLQTELRQRKPFASLEHEAVLAIARTAAVLEHSTAEALKPHGLTPTQYIIKVRVSAATRMLRETGRPVSEIAQACGFYDHSAFTRVFRKVTGLTPTQMRAG